MASHVALASGRRWCWSLCCLLGVACSSDRPGFSPSDELEQGTEDVDNATERDGGSFLVAPVTGTTSPTHSTSGAALGTELPTTGAAGSDNQAQTLAASDGSEGGDAPAGAEPSGVNDEAPFGGTSEAEQPASDPSADASGMNGGGEGGGGSTGAGSSGSAGGEEDNTGAGASSGAAAAPGEEAGEPVSGGGGSAPEPICEDGQMRACSDAGALGTCAAGVQVCVSDAWGPCDIQPAAEDTCEPDNDDNCNGAPNEACTCIDGATRSCDAAGLFGRCAEGTQVCAGGAWGDCSVQPADADTCEPDNDDNCNGDRNEGCPCTAGQTRPCSAGGLFGPCAEGTQSCTGDGTWGSCSIAPASFDTCSVGNDANCNGLANDPLDPSCDCLQGERQCVTTTPNTQYQTCSSSGSWGSAMSCEFACTGSGVCSGSCVPGSRQCEGNTPQECDTQGQWQIETACGASTPCQGAGECLACGAGSFASGGRCVPWTPCSNGQVEITAGTPTTDRVCGIPSCVGMTSNCGVSSNESCCTSQLVTGATFNRLNDASYPATVNNFRLDKFEVTVGRFRNFKAAWDSGWRPSSSSGKHSHLNSGSGLANSEGGTSYENGWNTSWASTVEVSDDSLTCDTGFQTWTASSGANERRPINCVNWYEAYAFCIWDGGFLPSEAEWNFAAAGGNEQRYYPWSNPPTSTTISPNTYASYVTDFDELCQGDGVDGCTLADIVFVGTKGAGFGRYSNMDLAGNVEEWTLDGYAAASTAFAAPCTNCLYMPAASTSRAVRGGSFVTDSNSLRNTGRGSRSAAFGSYDLGFRCARSP